MTSVAEAGEHALIARIRAKLAMPGWVLVGPGDDAAVVEPERGTVDVLTTDALVEGIHFDRRFTPPDAIGFRALAVNLSDLAAMGARPRAALLSLALPDALPLTDLDAIVDGLLALAARHGVALVGGNVTRSTGPLVINVTATGAVRRRHVLTRAGARPGDGVYVTGTIGDAALGLRLLQSAAELEGPLAQAAARYLRPEPRVRVGQLLARNRVATSCLDLSDGLADAVRQVAAASGVGILLDAASIPIHAAVRQWHAGNGSDALEAALTGGDDYELLFTARPRTARRLKTVRSQLSDLPITRIGVVTPERQILLAEAGTTRQLPSGFEHFR